MTNDRGDLDLSRRSLLLGGLMLGTSATAAGLQLRNHAQDPINRPLGGEIPNRMGPWVANEEGEIVRPAEAPGKARYDQELSRAFISPGNPAVMLLIAYGSTQSDTLQVHRPEFCYPAAGFKIGESRSVVQPITRSVSLPASFFTATRDERVEQVLYWVRLGEYFPDTWLRQHLARMKNAVRGLTTDGILVRASIIDPDAAKAQQLLVDFLQQLTLGATPTGRRVLLGRR